MQEDYPPAAYYSLMNLLDSHDTERALWALTPGEQTTAGRELDVNNFSEGKSRLQMAALIQFTVPGMPSIYYGDEVGVTGQADPDDRRTYPWADEGGAPDQDLFVHYQALAGLHKELPALADGDLRVLLADDADETIAFGRRTDDQAVVVAINRSGTPKQLQIPMAGFAPDGTVFRLRYNTKNPTERNPTVSDGELNVDIGAFMGFLLVSAEGADLAPPSVPEGLALQEEGDALVTIAWQPVAEGAGYNVYRSPLSGGGWVKVNDAPIVETTFSDPNAVNAKLSYYTVTAVDTAGNESNYSIETAGMAHLSIDQAKLVEPATVSHTISTTQPTAPARGQVTIASVDSVSAQLGFGPANTAPAEIPEWTWVDATLAETGGTATYSASLLPDRVGTFSYVFRFTSTVGREWVYADASGVFMGVPAQPGVLTVNASADTSAPATPTGVNVTQASVIGVDLEWDPVAGDPTLHGYEVARAGAPEGPFTTVTLVTEPVAHDPEVTSADPIYYVVRAVDTSFNRSADSAVVEAKPGPRPVSIVFNVTVPEPTGPAVGRSVYIAGYLDRLDPDLPQWDPAGVVMTMVDDTHWTVTLNGIEGTNIGYKYVLGDWNYVEKDESCAEISDRPLTVAYGQDGTLVVEDVVENWRNVASCPS